MKKPSKLQVVFRSGLFLLMFSYATFPVFSQTPEEKKIPPIKIGINQNQIIKTARVQAFRGDFTVTLFQAPPASISGSILSKENTALIIEDEHISFEILEKGIIAKNSDGVEFPSREERTMENRELLQGYGRIEIEGGDLYSLEIPNLPTQLFRGKISITLRDESLSFFIFQELDDYLCSAVSEFCLSSEPETIKAHLVLARTLAIHSLIYPRHATDSYNLCDTDHCLPVHGIGKDRVLVKNLMPFTKDEILLHDGKIFSPQFQNSCGGKISSAKDVFGYDDNIHLAKVDRPGEEGKENCFHSPNFEWEREFTKSEMDDFVAISYAGGAPNIYSGWQPTVLDPNGRILQITVAAQRDEKGRRNKDKVFSGIEFLRQLGDHFGPLAFPSTRFSQREKYRSIVFTGKGKGHGVGFCQYGADGLGRKGWNYIKILSFYFANSTIGTISKTASDLK